MGHAMTTRILPPAEWYRLQGTELETVWPVWQPDAATVLVVEEAGQIVGCWAFFSVVHAEGVWIAPAHRGRGGVTRALVRGMREFARTRGVRAIVTGCLSPLVARLLAHWHAVKLPGDLYVFSPEGH